MSNYQKQLAKLPPGKLLCEKNGNYAKWYISNGHTRTYLPKSNKELASKLAYKKYLQIKTNLISNQLSSIDLHSAKQQLLEKQLSSLLSNPHYQELLAPYLSIDNTDSFSWAAEKYPSNPYHPENLIHPSVGGIKVRSKSESLIALSLYQYQIPFRYECLLQLDSLYIYPDFTIMHPVTNQLIYWEHFGLMDHINYANEAASKLNIYVRNSIIPGVNLITSYETYAIPLSYETIDKLIHIYLL